MGHLINGLISDRKAYQVLHQAIDAIAKQDLFPRTSERVQNLANKVIGLNQATIVHLNNLKNEINTIKNETQKNSIINEVFSLQTSIDTENSYIAKALGTIHDSNKSQAVLSQVQQIDQLIQNIKITLEPLSAILSQLIPGAETSIKKLEAATAERKFLVAAEIPPEHLADPRISALLRNVDIVKITDHSTEEDFNDEIPIGSPPSPPSVLDSLSEEELFQTPEEAEIPIEHPLVSNPEDEAIQSLRKSQGMMRVINQKLMDALIIVDPNSPLKNNNILEEYVSNLIKLDTALPENLKDRSTQSSIGLACRYLANDYRKLGLNRQADYYMRLPSSITLMKEHALGDLTKLRAKTTNSNVIWHQIDSTSIRRSQMRICQKQFNDSKDPLLDLTCTLPKTVRKELQRHLDKMTSDELLQIDKNSHVLYHEMTSKGTLNSQATIDIGSAITLSSPDKSISVTIGNNPNLWSQYHKVTIQVSKRVSSENLYRFLSHAGLSSLMLDSRPQDSMMERIARLGAAYFPEDAAIMHRSPEGAAQHYLTALPGVSKRAAEMQLKDVGNGRMEYVDPKAVEDFQASTGAGFGVTLGRLGRKNLPEMLLGQGMHAVAPAKDAAKNLGYILKGGQLSTMERYEQGILTAGCCPMSNIETGSANQVFTRPLSSTQFSSNFPWTNYATEGSIFLLLKPEAAARLPYTYPSDRAGLRNPELVRNMPRMPHGEGLQLGLKGSMINERVSLSDVVSQQSKTGKTLITAETMFEDMLGPQYIGAVVVATEPEKEDVISYLISQGINLINNKSLDEAVLVGSTLTTEMMATLTQGTL